MGEQTQASSPYSTPRRPSAHRSVAGSTVVAVPSDLRCASTSNVPISAPSSRSSWTPKTCRRSRPRASIRSVVGVPCIAYARIVRGIGSPSGPGASTPTGNRTRYSCRNARNDSSPIASWCSNTVCSPITVSDSLLKISATRCACGMPCATHPGQSIWKACRTTTCPRRRSRLRASGVLNHGAHSRTAVKFATRASDI